MSGLYNGFNISCLAPHHTAFTRLGVIRTSVPSALSFTQLGVIRTSIVVLLLNTNSCTCRRTGRLLSLAIIAAIRG